MKTLSIQLRKGKFDLIYQKAALLVIDMQNDFCHVNGYNSQKLGLSLNLIEEAKKKIILLIDWCRSKNIRVIFTRESHKLDLVDLSVSKRNRYINAKTPIGDLGPMGRFLIRGHKGCALIDEIQPKKDEYIHVLLIQI